MWYQKVIITVLSGYHYASKNGIGENLGSRTDGIYIG